MADIYDSGDTVRVTNTDAAGLGFATAGGTPVTPATVTLSLRAPSGTVTDYTGAEIENPSTGVYYRDVIPGEDGVWFYRWQGTNPAAAAEGHFAIRPRAVPE